MRSLRSAAIAAATLLLGLALAACSGEAAGSPDVPASPSPGASTAPSLPAASASTGASESSGVVPPGEPVLGEPRIVTPKPGQLDVHPIAADQLSATVNGRDVVVEIRYASGVEPCYVLDSIVVQKGDHTVAMTLRQGHGPGDAVCIQLAEMVRSFVDLGELDPGTYTISDTQDGAAPITVTVP